MSAVDAAPGRRAVRGAIVGNLVEQADIFLPVIAFAPAAAAVLGPGLAAAGAGMLFAATLLGRPAGAALFGPLADRWGRTRIARVAIAGAAATTLLTAATPAGLGWGTLWMLLALRFAGGVFLGGGYTAAIPLAMEWTEPRRRGVLSGTVMAMSPVANALIAATSLGMLAALGAEAYAAWGWRVPFGVAGVATVGLLGVYGRGVRDVGSVTVAGAGSGGARRAADTDAGGMPDTGAGALPAAAGTGARGAGTTPSTTHDATHDATGAATAEAPAPTSTLHDPAASATAITPPTPWAPQPPRTTPSESTPTALADPSPTPSLLPTLPPLFLLMSGLWLFTNLAVAVLTADLGRRPDLGPAATSATLLGATLVSAVGMVAAGALSTRVGRRRFFLGFGAGAAVLAPGAFAWASVAGFPAVVVAASLLQLVTVAGYGPVGAYLAERFPARTRSTGYGLAYSLPIVLPALYPLFLPPLRALLGDVPAVALLLGVAGLLVCAGAALGRRGV